MCIRDRNLSYAEADKIAKAIPFDLKMTIDKALEMNPELRSMYESDQRIAKVIDMSRAIEGMPRHASTHAAGVVISKPVSYTHLETMLEKNFSDIYTKFKMSLYSKVFNQDIKVEDALSAMEVLRCV